MFKKWKSTINFWFEDIESLPGKTLDLAVIILIFVVCTIFIIKTYPINQKLYDILDNIENVIIFLFIIEYFLRIWSAPDKIKHFFNPYSIVDLLAIVPIFFAHESYQVLRIFRALRILRLMRFLKGKQFLFKKFETTHIIIIRIIFIIFSIIFVSAGMIFYAEHGKPGSNINSFSDAAYFSIVTLTTVGYGDITPATGYGRFITVLIVLSGIIFLPMEIRQLIRQFRISDEKDAINCSSCDLPYHDHDANFCKNCGAELNWD